MLPEQEVHDTDRDVGLFTVLKDDGTTDAANDPKLPKEVVLRG